MNNKRNARPYDWWPTHVAKNLSVRLIRREGKRLCREARP